MGSLRESECSAFLPVLQTLKRIEYARFYGDRQHEEY